MTTPSASVPSRTSEAEPTDDASSISLSRNADFEKRIRILEERIRDLREENARLRRQWDETTQAISWRIINMLSRPARRLAPLGSRRRRVLRSACNLAARARRALTPIVRVPRHALTISRGAAWTIRRLAERPRPFVADDRPVFLFVSHVWGGGVRRHIQDMADRLRLEEVRVVVARPNPQGRLVFEEPEQAGAIAWRVEVRPRRPIIEAYLDAIQPVFVHVHHRLGVPETLFKALDARGLPTDWTLHDYHALCPRVHLHDDRGEYCGQPDPEGCRTCLKSRGDYHGRRVNPDVVAHRHAWRACLQAARRIYVPSEDMKRRLQREFPDLDMTVHPHLEPSLPQSHMARRWRDGEPVRVAVLGVITLVKGLNRLLEAAHDAWTRALPLTFVVIGTADRSEELLATGHVEITGRYRESEIETLLDEAKCHLAWLPSTLPETYMYTLSIAQAAGFRPVVYDLGAQAERVGTAGRRVPLETSAATLNDCLLQWAALDAQLGPLEPPRFADYPSLLSDYYELSPANLKASRSEIFPVTRRRIHGVASAPVLLRKTDARLHQRHR